MKKKYRAHPLGIFLPAVAFMAKLLANEGRINDLSCIN